jgi:hypothetical protein
LWKDLGFFSVDFIESRSACVEDNIKQTFLEAKTFYFVSTETIEEESTVCLSVGSHKEKYGFCKKF